MENIEPTPRWGRTRQGRPDQL